MAKGVRGANMKGTISPEQIGDFFQGNPIRGRSGAKKFIENRTTNQAKETSRSTINNSLQRSFQSGGIQEKLPANLRYPYSTIDHTQDFIKFTIFEYSRAGGYVTRDQNTLKKDLIGSIILPIPAQLVDSNAANYGQGGMNFMQEQGLGAASSVIGGDLRAAGTSVNNLIASVTGNRDLIKQWAAVQAMNTVGGNLTLEQVLARGSGQVINPNMELLFSGPTLRDFSYQFKFTPRFQKEAQTVRTIIKAFKKNMAPKGSGGAFLKSPNIFQIEYVGEASQYLNRIKLCALKTVAMNYTADGTFATYNDGSPISMNMTLSFTELMPVYNEDYGSYSDRSDGVGY